MADNSESIKKDRQYRVQGERFYSDQLFRSQELLNISGSTASEVFVDVPNSSITFLAEKNINVIILFEGEVYSAIPAAMLYAVVAVNLDGVNLVPRVVSSLGRTVEHEMAQFVETLSAGSHTVKLQIVTENAASEAILGGGNLSILYLTE